MGKKDYSRKLARIITVATVIPLVAATTVLFYHLASMADAAAMRPVLLLLVAVDICAMLAVWWAIRSLSAYALLPRRPLAAARQVAAGNFDFALKMSDSEEGELAQVFHAMVAALAHRAHQARVISEITRGISVNMSLDELVQRAWQHLQGAAPVKQLYILLKAETAEGGLRLVHALPAFAAGTYSGQSVPVAHSLCQWAVAQRRVYRRRDLPPEEQYYEDAWLCPSETDYAVLPLVAGNRALGAAVVCLASSEEQGGDMAFVAEVMDHLAIALYNAMLFRQGQRMYLDTIETLAATLEMKDKYTEGHSRRVAAYAVQIATSLGWTPEQVARINIAGLLHDIGKIGITEQILNKPGALTREEYEVIKTHPTIAARILARLQDSEEIVAWIAHHHERYDGHGYPAGLAGEAIPLGARILTVADAFDAMTSTRAYRCGFPRSEAMRDLAVNAGSQFDPLLVQVFLTILRQTTRVSA